MTNEAMQSDLTDEFDDLMDEAKAAALIGEFGTDDQLEQRISRDNGGPGSGTYC